MEKRFPNLIAKSSILTSTRPDLNKEILKPYPEPGDLLSESNGTMDRSFAAGTQPARPQNAYRPQTPVIALLDLLAKIAYFRLELDKSDGHTPKRIQRTRAIHEYNVGFCVGR